MTKTVGPVWIVQPESADEMPHPEHPIVLPPDVPDANQGAGSKNTRPDSLVPRKNPSP